MSGSFSITPDCTDQCDYISLSGNIDAAAEKQLQEVAGMVSSRTVRFDFSRTGRINSMGIALLLRCFKNIRDEKKAEIFLRELNPTNTILFKMTGIFMLANHEK